MFIVPTRSLSFSIARHANRRASVLAAANLLSFVGMFLASAGATTCRERFARRLAAFSSIGAILTLVATVYLITCCRTALLRFVLLAADAHDLSHSRRGPRKYSGKGGALFVCNHLSLADAMLLLASTDRHVRFMMFKAHLRTAAGSNRSRKCWRDSDFLRATSARNAEVAPRRQRRHQKRRGRLHLCRRPNHAHRPDDAVSPRLRAHHERRRGADHSGALDGVWGSIFSFERGRFLWKWPRDSASGHGELSASRCRTPPRRSKCARRCRNCNGEAWPYRKTHMKTLHRRVRAHGARIRSASRWPSAKSEDEFRLRAAANDFSGAAAEEASGQGQKMVGLLLPPSVPGALVNFAALLAGKVPVNLNYTVLRGNARVMHSSSATSRPSSPRKRFWKR